MADAKERILDQINDLLDTPEQYWLLGAGISKEAGIPLMNTLTDHIQSLLDDEYSRMYTEIRENISQNANVEDILSHIGDLIAIAERSREGQVNFNGTEYSIEYLQNFHSEIQTRIRNVVRFGFKKVDGGSNEVGESENPIVDVKNHLTFVKALFDERRAGFNRRPPIKFFTTNYDTLLEDAFALNKIKYVDGFSGGAMAHWNPEVYQEANSYNIDAELYKLHGSIDWFVNEKEIVVRRREGAKYPDENSSRLLIYPQATKYMITRKDPFANLFSIFRDSLYTEKSTILGICGYSFSDEHINEEINQIMSINGNSLTIIAFVKQDGDKLQEQDKGLPKQIYQWLNSEDLNWRDRLIVATDHGLYQGNLENQLPVEGDNTHSWWKFSGLTDLLKNGPEALV